MYAIIYIGQFDIFINYVFGYLVGLLERACCVVFHHSLVVLALGF